MRASAERFGLPVRLKVYPAGDWLQIVRSKVSFLIEQRAQTEGALLYVDVDAWFHSDPWPHLVELDVDVSFAVLLDGKARSGTIYLADTPGARRFLLDWQARLEANPQAWDQRPLDDVVRDHRDGALSYRWANLPPGLCYIFDRGEETAGAGVVPVIEHLQASRELTAQGKPKQLRRAARVDYIDQLLGLRPPTAD